MNVDEKTMGIVGGIVLIFGMVVLYLQLTAGTGTPPSTPQPTPAKPAQPHAASSSSVTPDATVYGSPCGSSSGSCLAETEVKADGCEQVRSREKIANTLANPISVGGCATIEAQLQQGCAPGCQLDSSSLVIVPGKVEYSVDGQRDALGRCTIRGKRAVRVSGECVTSASPQ